jgi:hypothetical protein
VVPGQSELADDGLEGHLCNALAAGGERNGVRTAVEDFLRESETQFKQCDVGGAGGLALLIAEATVADNAALSDMLDALSSPDHLRAWVGQVDGLRIAAELEATRLRAEVQAAPPPPEERPGVPPRVERMAVELELVRDAHRRLEERFEQLASELAQTQVERDRYQRLARRPR